MPPALEKKLLATEVRRRRQDVGISQDLLAWVARVSRNTVSNLERGHGEPEERTVGDIARALGMKTNEPSLDFTHDFDMAMENAGRFRSVVSASATRRVYEIVNSFRDQDSSGARKFADAYMSFVQARSSGDRALPGMRTSSIKYFISTLRDQLRERTDLEAEDPLIPMLQDYGWSPEDDEVAALEEFDRVAFGASSDRHESTDALVHEFRGMLVQLEQLVGEGAHNAGAFARLPLRVQAALDSGEVVDSDVIKAPNTDGVSIVTMVVRDEPDKPVTQKDRRALLDVLYIWHQAVWLSASSIDVLKELGNWVPPEKMEAEVLKALSTIGKHQPLLTNAEANERMRDASEGGEG